MASEICVRPDRRGRGGRCYAVKFQTFKAEKLAAEQAPKAAYQVENTGVSESQQSMLRKLELPLEWHAELQAHARARGLDFLSTAFDEDSLGFLATLGLPVLKVPSGELTNAPLLWKFARLRNTADPFHGHGDPVGGGASARCCFPRVRSRRGANRSARSLVRVGLAAIPRSPRGPVTLLHCTTQYPTPPTEVNLRAMDTLAAAFGLRVGYSDHSEGIFVPVAAVARGARVIEKHFTVDRSLPPGSSGVPGPGRARADGRSDSRGGTVSRRRAQGSTGQRDGEPSRGATTGACCPRHPQGCCLLPRRPHDRSSRPRHSCGRALESDRPVCTARLRRGGGDRAVTEAVPLILLGAGGHAKVLLSLIRATGARIAGVCDPALAGTRDWRGVPVLGDDSALARFDPAKVSLINGIGQLHGSNTRRKVYDRFKAAGFEFPPQIHPTAWVNESASVGEGVQIMAGAVVQPDVQLGDNTIVNTGATIDHDCLIGRDVHIAPGVTLCGGVRVADRCLIASGATVTQGISVGAGATIGAGVTLVRDLPAGEVVIGPAFDGVDLGDRVSWRKVTNEGLGAHSRSTRHLSPGSHRGHRPHRAAHRARRGRWTASRRHTHQRRSSASGSAGGAPEHTRSRSNVSNPESCARQLDTRRPGPSCVRTNCYSSLSSIMTATWSGSRHFTACSRRQSGRTRSS